MADMGGKDTQAVVSEVLAGIKNGPTVFNGPMSRLAPALTFKDAVPEDIQKMQNMNTTPKEGSMLDSWVTRRPNSSKP